MIYGLTLGLIVAHASILMALPLLQAGSSVDTEMVISALHMAGIITLATLAWYAPREERARQAILHPLALIPMGMAIWSLAGMAFAEFPRLAFLGPIETGQGVLWYVDLSAFVSAALIIKDCPKQRKITLSTLIFISLSAGIFGLRNLEMMQPYMQNLSFLSEITYYGFSDYQVYYAIPLITLGLAWIKQERALSISALFVAAFLHFSANNRTAFVGGALIVPPLGLLLWLFRSRLTAWGEKRWLTVVLSLGVAAILICSYPAIRQIPHTPALETLWSRAIIGMAIEPSVASPLHLLVGNGWGHYEQELVRNIDTLQIRLHDSEWRDIARNEFHTHNVPLEALLAAGIPGAFLTILFSIAAIWFAAPRYRFLAAGMATYTALMDSLWFQMPMTLAAMAMMVAVTAESRVACPRLNRSPRILRYGYGALALAVACGLFLTARYALSFEHWKHCANAATPTAECQAKAIPADPRGINLGLATLLNNASVKAGEQAAKNELSSASAAFLKSTLQKAQPLAAQGGLSLEASINNAYAQWAWLPTGSLLALSADDIRTWSLNQNALLQQAPQRFDLQIPYITWLLGNKRDAEAAQMIAIAKRTIPDHPTLLWFQGIITLADPSPEAQAKGLQLLRSAIAGGIEKYLPVPAETKAMIGVQ